jgi:GNAT superfamily N-acetyltransferase
MQRYKFKEVSSELWPDFEKLFGKNGACGGCWCQWWRLPRGGQLWQETKGARAKRTMKYLFKNNMVTGLLAYDGDLPVAWCSYGPRTDFPRTERMKAYRRDDIDNVWSLNCFFIDKRYRRTGLGREILSAALRFMKKRKVKIVEAYPVPLTKDGKKLPAAFVYTGPLKIFEEAGFGIVQRLSYSRPLVRKSLT